MAAPQNEQEYRDALAQRLRVLEQIKAVEKDIADMGFLPRDAVRHNQLIAERLRMLKEEQQLGRQIGGASSAVTGAYQFRSDAARIMEQRRQQREADARQAALMREVRGQELRRDYGRRVGGLVAGAEAFGQTRVGGAMRAGGMAAGGFIVNGARQGFQGTVESERIQFEQLQLNRELAAAMKPLTDLYTEGVTRLRKFLQGLDSTGQNVVMVAGALGSLALGMRMIGGFGGRGMMGGAMMGGMMGGMEGAVGGALLGGLMGGGGGGGGAATGGAMNMAALAAASRGGSAATVARRGLASRIARFPIKHPLLTAGAVIAGGAALSGGGSNDYRANYGAEADALDKMERSGGTDAMLAEYNRIKGNRTAGAKTYSFIGGMFGNAGQEHDKLVELERRLMAQGVTPGTGKRQMTPSGAAYGEAGSTYRQAQLDYVNMYSPESKSGGSWKPPSMKDIEEKGLFGAVGTPVGDDQPPWDVIAGMLEQIAKNTEKKPEVK